MKVTIRYQTQIKRAVGLASETVEVPDSFAVVELLHDLGRRHGDGFRRLVLKETGAPQDSILLFVGDRQLPPGEGRARLRDGDVVTLLAPMAGG